MSVSRAPGAKVNISKAEAGHATGVVGADEVVGAELVGDSVGIKVGASVGLSVGIPEGAAEDGTAVGVVVGDAVVG